MVAKGVQYVAVHEHIYLNKVQTCKVGRNSPV